MKQRGFTLLEVMVATVIMAVAITGLLSALSASLRNAARLTDYDQATLLGREKMDELLAAKKLPRFQVFEGQFPGRAAGWKARVTPFETVPNPAPGYFALDRVELEVWWMSADRRRTFAIEGFKRSVLTQEDIAQGVGRMP